jgi:hypothetical protein
MYNIPKSGLTETPKNRGETIVSTIPVSVRRVLHITHLLVLTPMQKYPKIRILIDSIRCKMATVSTLIMLRPVIMKYGARQEYKVDPKNNQKQSLYDKEYTASSVSCFQKNIVIKNNPTRFEEQRIVHALKISSSISLSFTKTLFEAEKINMASARNIKPLFILVGVACCCMEVK